MLFSVLLLTCVSCNEENNSEKNDNATSNKITPMMAHSCVGFEWDDTCYGNYFYECDSSADSFVQNTCSKSEPCTHFEGEKPYCDSLEYQTCDKSQGDSYKCLYKYTISHFQCKKNIIDNEYYLVDKTEECLDECINDKCIILKDIEPQMKCDLDTDDDYVSCSTIDDMLVAHWCRDRKPLIWDSLSHRNIKCDTKYCDPNAPTEKYCVDYNPSIVNCKNKEEGHYCANDGNNTYSYECKLETRSKTKIMITEHVNKCTDDKPVCQEGYCTK